MLKRQDLPRCEDPTSSKLLVLVENQLKEEKNEN
jgi:hypothetical protein